MSDDVLDDDDVPAFEAGVEVLDQLDLTRGLGALAVARDRHEVERAVARQRPRQIRQEDERPLEHADEMHPVGVVGADLLRHRLDALLDGFGGDEDVDHLSPDRTRE